MAYSKKIRGVKLVYEDTVDGIPILMIHGQPFNRSMWKYQADAFQGDYRLVIPDLRGYGDSELPTGMVLLDELALDLAELLDELQISEAILLGLSMGGQIALEFFKLFPERVKGLVLADTDCRAEDAAGYQRRLQLAQQMREGGMKKFAEERIHHFLSEKTINQQSEVVTHLKVMMETTSPAGASFVQRGRAERKDLTALLGLIEVPTLIVVGQEDEFTPVSTARFMYERINGSKLSIIEGAGHLPNMEQPEAFNTALRSFLKENF